MARPAPTTRAARALRAALVGLVVAGYALALGATASGEGLALIPHLILAHDALALPPPTVGQEPQADKVIPTLRPDSHTHGEGRHTHQHGSDAHAHDDAAEAAPPAAWQTLRAEASERDAGWHTHGDEAHRHLSPEPDPGPESVLAFSLDEHRLPTALVPSPPPVTAADRSDPTETIASHEASVETPPPIARG